MNFFDENGVTKKQKNIDIFNVFSTFLYVSLHMLFYLTTMFTILETITMVLAIIAFFIFNDSSSKLLAVIIGIASLIKAIYNFKTVNKVSK